jgi:hypothetical protein
MSTHCPRTIAAVALTATGLLLTACNSSPSQPTAHSAKPIPSAVSHSPTAAAAPVSTASAAAQASTANACALITEPDATTAFGADPGPGEAAPGHCIYASGGSSMNITVRTLPDGAASFARLRSALGSHAVDVPDVGDGAFGTFQGPIAVVHFYKGDTLVAVELAMSGASTSSQDQTTALAKIAAGRV